MTSKLSSNLAQNILLIVYDSETIKEDIKNVIKHILNVVIMIFFNWEIVFLIKIPCDH